MKKDRPLRTAMNYQLVLQIPTSPPFVDCAAMISLKNALIEELGDSANVDRHAYGSSKMDIFIFTSDPAATFSRVKLVLTDRQCLHAVTAAFRQVSGEDSGEDYTVIWPEGSQKDFVIT